MAATGFSPVYLYASGTTGHIPLAANLTNTTIGSEIALNYSDGNLFFKNASNAVITTPLLQSSGSQNGWLSSTDWTTFNNKAPAFTYTTGYVPFGQGTTTPTQSANLFFNGNSLGIGTATPSKTGYPCLTINGPTLPIIEFSTSDSLTGYIYSNTTQMTLDNNGAKPLTFNTSNAEAMRISASGGVSIGNTTDPGAANLSVSGTIHSNGELGIGTGGSGGTPTIKLGPGDASHPSFYLYPYNKVSGPNTNFGYQYFNGDNNALYVINTSNGVYLGNNGTSWASASDERTKDIIEPITNAADKVKQLRTVIGKYKTDNNDTRRAFLIAQDFLQVLPEVVDTSNPDTLGLLYSDTVVLAFAAINELITRIEKLESK